MKGGMFMAKKSSATPLLTGPQDEMPLPEVRMHIKSNQKPTKPWLGVWFSAFLVLGLLILLVASTFAWNLLKNVKITTNPVPTQAPINTLNVQRTADYAGLEFTVVNVQYATSFLDDTIHPGAAIVRLNMKVANKSSDQVTIVYYDIARLLGSKSSLFNPTNVHLSIGPKPGTSESGWIDFAVPAGLQLDTMQLQMGSTLLGESLVTIPFTGPFDGSRYNDRTVAQTLTINYYFPYNNQQLLIYHLTRVEIRNDYRGVQVKAGQQYYVLYFRVENPNVDKVSPGFGYDYIRLIYNGGPTHPPVDNTLPYGFSAGKTTGGQVAFVGPAGMRAVTLDFLVQYGSGGSNYHVSL
jgi:hypothetical protein